MADITMTRCTAVSMPVVTELKKNLLPKRMKRNDSSNCNRFIPYRSRIFSRKKQIQNSPATEVTTMLWSGVTKCVLQRMPLMIPYENDDIPKTGPSCGLKE